MKILRNSFIWVTVLGLVASCGEEENPFPPGPGPDGDITFGIRGDLDLSDYERVARNDAPYNTSEYPDFSPVVSFVYSINGSDEYDFVASGVLISPDWILSAGHNFFVSDDQSSPAPESGIRAVYGDDPNNEDNYLEVEEVIYFPTWLEDDDIFGKANDFCLVRLKEPLNGITPAKMLTTESEPLNTLVWACGFGDYSQEPGQDPDFYSLKHATSSILDRVVGGITSSSSAGTFTGGLLAVDFDSPSGQINTLGDDYISPDEPLLGTGTSSPTVTEFEAGAVQGDSGGPLFVRVNGEWLVAGILSGSAEEPFIGHVGNSYGEIDIYTRVSLAYDWINEVTGL
ncbi:S1 family peptidase [Algoriphagus sediminis]|uniref:Trypsin-like serine protease n=1 Tax=Algoriphagus sediminis TaxID=3057113 RepID=A0ABT7YCK8_9BACT|nr:trypsin-like serine protease [Algoriphagus sediminis]MDN3204259.1 trypsin-like serine protease [Algoriphagus sediminis]